MRVAILLSFSFVIAVGVLAACNSQEAVLPQAPSTPVQSPQPKNPADEARRITAEELHKLWEKKDVLIIDTRGEPDYKAEPHPGLHLCSRERGRDETRRTATQQNDRGLLYLTGRTHERRCGAHPQIKRIR